MTLVQATAAAALISALTTLPAFAQNSRSFVSSKGLDTNSCILQAPCRTFQRAHDVTNANGEIDVLDTAGYGPVVINRAISIINPAGSIASLVASAGASGIIISAGPSDAVTLRGLTVNGNITGDSGIVFNSGGILTIDNCVVQNFKSAASSTTGNGILLKPTSGTVIVTVTSTTVSNNKRGGLVYDGQAGSASARIVIDHLATIANTYGAYFGNLGSGAVVASIANSNASSNSTGVYAYNDHAGSSIILTIDNLSAIGNGVGIDQYYSANVLLGRSTIANNAIGIRTNSQKFFTYQNNQVNENTSDVVTGVDPLQAVPLR